MPREFSRTRRVAEQLQRELAVLVRDEIKLEDKAAKSEVIETGNGLRVGVIEVPAFYRDFAGQAAGDENFRSTTRDVRKLLEELQAQDAVAAGRHVGHAGVGQVDVVPANLAIRIPVDTSSQRLREELGSETVRAALPTLRRLRSILTEDG